MLGLSLSSGACTLLFDDTGLKGGGSAGAGVAGAAGAAGAVAGGGSAGAGTAGGGGVAGRAGSPGTGGTGAGGPGGEGGGPPLNDRQYEALVLAEKPIAYYRFSERADDGVARNLVPGGPDGRYVGSPRPGALGVQGTGLGLDGESFVAFEGLEFPLYLPFTVEFWVAPARFEGPQYLFSAGTPAQGGLTILLNAVTPSFGFLGASLTDLEGNGHDAALGSPLFLGRFVYVGVAFDGATLTACAGAGGPLECASSDVSNAPIAPIADGTVRLGSFFGESFNTVGVVDELALYRTPFFPRIFQLHADIGGLTQPPGEPPPPDVPTFPEFPPLPEIPTLPASPPLPEIPTLPASPPGPPPDLARAPARPVRSHPGRETKRSRSR